MTKATVTQTVQALAAAVLQAPRPLTRAEAQRLLNHTATDYPTARKALQAAADASGRSVVTRKGQTIGDRASKASCVRLASWAQGSNTLV
jgi:hypothetical protein